MALVSLWDEGSTQFSTPEQVDLRLELGNIGSRGLAVMFDTALRYGVVFLLYVILISLNQMERIATYLTIGPKAFVILFLLVVFVSEWFYFTLFEWAWNGQTPGKRLMRLRVIKEDGSPMSWLEVLLRNFLRPIDTSGPFALIGMAFIFFSPKGQRPGDLLARTLVIREPKIDWDALMASEEISSARLQPSMFSPMEWEMVSRYVQRASGFDSARRAALAEELRRVLLPKVRGTDLQNSSLDAHNWLLEISRRQ